MPRWKDKATLPLFAELRADGSGGQSSKMTKKVQGEWDALMQGFRGTTDAEEKAAHRASVKWHEDHAAKCAEGLDLSWCAGFDAVKAANEARARWLRIQRSRRSRSSDCSSM